MAAFPPLRPGRAETALRLMSIETPIERRKP